MKIITNGQYMANELVFATLVSVGKDDFQFKKSRDESGKEYVKKSPDGRAVYRTQLKALSLDDDGFASREEYGIYLGVLEPCDLNPGVFYFLDGTVWITPFSTGGRNIGYSIIAERVVPAGE